MQRITRRYSQQFPNAELEQMEEKWHTPLPRMAKSTYRRVIITKEVADMPGIIREGTKGMHMQLS